MPSSLICHNHSPITGSWQCVLCEQIVSPPNSAHFCIVEARIREIIREEITKQLPTPAPHSPLWHLSEDNRRACPVCNPPGQQGQPG